MTDTKDDGGPLRMTPNKTNPYGYADPADKDDGGPFHPYLAVWENATTKTPEHELAPGASFRAVAAMHAMAGLLTVENIDSEWGSTPEHIAKKSVRFADALIAELKK